ncbi:uncharacterized protein F5891DRAFT_1187580 [Suillus fuscotomentosus]|uniref:Uncharacterized protein n=1 Tax=Suillus fuscotomentosus TaxID=1912939 RepID=A0AAD4HKS3_9AGAM|nr:uncharacterized protein F5891DRAFT_1187580 [Suillus fuscotomentosus]KAG1901305.1 hypothetical protein F5891DRAFT_1187580 [Suillus fuscotomentosus]
MTPNILRTFFLSTPTPTITQRFCTAGGWCLRRCHFTSLYDYSPSSCFSLTASPSRLYCWDDATFPSHCITKPFVLLGCYLSCRLYRDDATFSLTASPSRLYCWDDATFPSHCITKPFVLLGCYLSPSLLHQAVCTAGTTLPFPLTASPSHLYCWDATFLPHCFTKPFVLLGRHYLSPSLLHQAVYTAGTTLPFPLTASPSRLYCWDATFPAVCTGTTLLSPSLLHQAVCTARTTLLSPSLLHQAVCTARTTATSSLTASPSQFVLLGRRYLSPSLLHQAVCTAGTLSFVFTAQ